MPYPIIAVLIFLALFLFSVVLVAIIFFCVFNHWGFTPRFFFTFDDLKERENFEIKPVYLKIGRKKIRGYFSGDPKSKKLVVISHGIQSDSSSYASEAKYFAEHGFYVFSYDNFACGESDGFHSGGLITSAKTLDKILSRLEEDYPEYEIVLYGHSWGGYAVLASFALNSHGVKRVVSVCPYNRADKVSMDVGKKIFGVLNPLLYPAVCVNLFLKYGKKGFLKASDGINSASNDVEFWVIQAKKDDIVGFSTSSLYSDRQRIKNPDKVKFTLKDRGHNSCLLTKEAAEAEEKFEREEFKRVRGVKDLALRFSRADRERFSVLDEELMSEICDFFRS